MDTYQWQLNKAVVDRLYYTEKIWSTTYGFAALFTAANMLYIKKGYFTNLMRSRLLPCWIYSTGFNLAITFIMLKPLRPEEISAQVKKRILEQTICQIRLLLTLEFMFVYCILGITFPGILESSILCNKANGQ